MRRWRFRRRGHPRHGPCYNAAVPLTRLPGGLLVAIEGIDGAGKTSVSTLLSQYCGERGIACLLSKEPTSLKWGQELRRSASTGRLTLDDELELFYKDRQEHVERSIAPALAEGSVVLLDRYYWSNAAYQGGRGADVAQVLARNETFAPKPDLWLLMDVEAAVGRERIQRRGDAPNLFEDHAALTRAREIFLALAEQTPTARTLDASGALKSVAGAALQAFRDALSQKLPPDGELRERLQALLG